MSGDDRIRDEDDDGQDTYEANELDLNGEDEERLPWLESSDDDYYEEGTDLGRVLGMTLLGLVALAAIVGGIWWSTHRTPDATLVADGSTIKAPAEPYKTAPKDPGGKTFEGTGDTAFAVSEGQSRAARLGEAGSSPAATRPSVDLAPKAPAPPSARASASAAARPTTASTPAAATAAAGTLVQVGAYSTRASAEAAWSRLSGQYSALSGQRHQIVEGQADIGTVFRLQALPGSASAAQSLCGQLKSSGLSCQVK